MDNQSGLQRKLKEKNREIEKLKKQLRSGSPGKGLSESNLEQILGEKMKEIEQKHNDEKEMLEKELGRMQEEIEDLKGENEEVKNMPNPQDEKRKVYDRLLQQERMIEDLQNKLESAHDDKNNLRMMLQNNEESRNHLPLHKTTN